MARTKFSGEQVVETESYVFFWKPPAVFGQWTPSRFIINEVQYNCAEQFMMAEKARLFGDDEMLTKILKSTSPRSQKAFGRKVKNFDVALWERECFGIVVRANLAKFSQNPEMLATLLATGEKGLVEASPYDRIWGIGLRADDPRVNDPQKWRGRNLLGQALEQVRAELRAQQN